MISQSNQYFKHLLYHLSKANNLNHKEKNSYWIEEYEKFLVKKIESNVMNLPLIMPLIYPDFLYNSSGLFIGEFINYNASNFNSGINLSDECQFGSIHENGYCEFNNFKHIRGKCQADHFWPFSLGGPSILENRVLLCRFHNLAKSNSVLNDFWIQYPSWIYSYLKRMYDLKK